MPGAQCDESRGIVGRATLDRLESRDRVPAPGRLAPRVAHAHLLLRKQSIDDRRQLVEYAVDLRQFALLPRIPPVPLGASARFPLLLEIEDGHRRALPTPDPVRFSDYHQALTSGGPALHPVGRAQSHHRC